MVQRVSPALGVIQQHLKCTLLVRFLTALEAFVAPFHSYFLGFLISGPGLLVLNN